MPDEANQHPLTSLNMKGFLFSQTQAVSILSKDAKHISLTNTHIKAFEYNIKNKSSTLQCHFTENIDKDNYAKT